MSKKPQYDPEEIRFPNQKIVTSSLVTFLGGLGGYSLVISKNSPPEKPGVLAPG